MIETKTKIRLPRAAEKIPIHAFFLRIPMPLRNRMITEKGLKWGEFTQFILDAICEKLEREAQPTQ